MAKIVGNSIISAIELWRGRQRPMVEFSEEDDESIIRPPMPLHITSWHWWGYYLNMAPNVSCVVIHPSGQPEVHLTGGMKTFTPGWYQLHYIDMREHTSLLSDVEAHTSDAWRVRLTLDLAWQVRDPLRVIRMSDPRSMLIERCVAAIANYIQSMPYEKLIATPETAPEDEDQIVTDILKRLNNNRALHGFRFINLSILGRQGDPERTEIIKKAMNQVEEAKRGKDVADARTATAEAEAKLKLAIAQGNLGVEKLAAEYTRDINELLMRTREQLILLEQLRESRQLKQERIIRAWEITGDAMTKMAGILGQAQANPSAQHLLDAQVVETVMQIMKQLASMLPPQTVLLDDSGDEHRVLPAISIHRSR